MGKCPAGYFRGDVQQMFLWLCSGEFPEEFNFLRGEGNVGRGWVVRGACPDPHARLQVCTCSSYYMISATEVNTQTHTDRQADRLCYKVKLSQLS